jgi:uncharacterized protein with HEPN domain
MGERDRQALIDILAVLDRALGYPIPDHRTFLDADYLQDALIRCLEVTGEAVKRLSQECRDRNPALPWRGMAGMRDLLIHSYDRVDLEEVWQAYRQFPEIRRQIAELLQRETLT